VGRSGEGGTKRSFELPTKQKRPSAGQDAKSPLDHQRPEKNKAANLTGEQYASGHSRSSPGKEVGESLDLCPK